MLRGRLPWGGGGDDEERAARRLLVAVALQAVRDALHGDGDAAAWLAEAGPGVAVALDLRQDIFTHWRAVGRVVGGAKRAARLRVTSIW